MPHNSIEVNASLMIETQYLKSEKQYNFSL